VFTYFTYVQEKKVRALAFNTQRKIRRLCHHPQQKAKKKKLTMSDPKFARFDGSLLKENMKEMPLNAASVASFAACTKHVCV
jgi:hypothetical protein